MPAKPTWLLRIPEIISALEEINVPVVDRSLCERLFGVRRRQAISILQMFGGYQAGRTHLVSRTEVIEQLRAVAAGPVFASESRRKRKLTASLDELHRHRAGAQIRIPASKRAGAPACLGCRTESLSLPA